MRIMIKYSQLNEAILDEQAFETDTLHARQIWRSGFLWALNNYN